MYFDTQFDEKKEGNIFLQKKILKKKKKIHLNLKKKEKIGDVSFSNATEAVKKMMESRRQSDGLWTQFEFNNTFASIVFFS